jgi:hypothetical protein
MDGRSARIPRTGCDGKRKTLLYRVSESTDGGRGRTTELGIYTALICLTTDGRTLRNTRYPQMHFTSGRLPNSSWVVLVPQRTHSYTDPWKTLAGSSVDKSFTLCDCLMERLTPISILLFLPAR